VQTFRQRTEKATRDAAQAVSAAEESDLLPALTRWEDEGGRAASDWKGKVPSVPRDDLLPSPSFRLIKAMAIDPDLVIEAFEALATKIQNRDGCSRVTALQQTIDENPEKYSQYCWAMGQASDLVIPGKQVA
jgi:hypothetical protein